MRFINIKIVQQAIPVLALIVSGACAAQNVSISDQKTTYPVDINPKPAVVSQCTGCHGPQGISQFPDWPNLAGLSDEYIKDELQKFKNGQRSNAMMQIVAQDISEQEMIQAAVYFSKQDVAVNVPKELIRPKALKTCITCHGDSVEKSSGLGPNLAGQKESYLLKQMQDFKSRKRNNEIMANIIKNVSPENIRELARYYSHLNIHVNSKTGVQ
ncbi:conserved exported hypothetical protein [Candidatus Nitrotoga sp. HW29]|uniref:c-type cytochrome n=1 Tax=Candidatus Nitrotoga sp. HW29 TaxID=2886963 RepID=UPI001EF25D47|nr:c-type cytochrome [Candidatus Nitrotoga sp. HW29]CAH1905345.1 conserved exported hypothetical protein [Candidatus Nitrotoga sp. HW29]